MNARASATQDMASSVREFLALHPTEAFRPVPIAKAIGEKDVRLVRAALRGLKDAGEVVTCTIYRGDEGTDEEYRIIAGGRMPAAKPLHATPPPPRRPDASTIPSRMGGIDIQIPQFRKVADEVAAAPTQQRLRKPDPCRVFGVVAPKQHYPWCSRAAKPEKTEAVAASAKKKSNGVDHGAVEEAAASKREGVQYGRYPNRQRSILEYIQSVNRRVTSSELVDHFHEAEPALKAYTVSNAIQKMLLNGVLVRTGNVREARRGGMFIASYATPEIAAQLEKAVVELVAVAAASSVADPAARKTTREAPRSFRSDARENLASFFKDSDGNWYGLPWLVRVAGGDVPATLEAIAELQIDGRVAYAEADRAPIWRREESGW